MHLSMYLVAVASSLGMPALAFGGTGEFARGLLANPESYRVGVEQAYAMDAGTLAKIYDDPAAARELVSLRGSEVLVTGSVVRAGSVGIERNGFVLESNRRDREVWCVPAKGESTPGVAPGSIVSVTGKLAAPQSQPHRPIIIGTCNTVWSAQEPGIAAATMLWCSLPKKPTTDSERAALRRGGELLKQAGLDQPPIGCNAAVQGILEECAKGSNRGECTTQWVSDVLTLMKPTFADTVRGAHSTPIAARADVGEVTTALVLLVPLLALNAWAFYAGSRLRLRRHLVFAALAGTFARMNWVPLFHPRYSPTDPATFWSLLAFCALLDLYFVHIAARSALRAWDASGLVGLGVALTLSYPILVPYPFTLLAVPVFVAVAFRALRGPRLEEPSPEVTSN